MELCWWFVWRERVVVSEEVGENVRLLGRCGLTVQADVWFVARDEHVVKLLVLYCVIVVK